LTVENQPRNDEGAAEKPDDPVRAWWEAVLAGQPDEPHPVRGPKVRAHVEGETLVITGSVLTEEERDQVQSEAEELKGHGVAEIRNQIGIQPDAGGEPGLLTQTLVAAFENPDLARAAQSHLDSSPHAPAQGILLIDPASPESAEMLRDSLPEAYWDDATKEMKLGHTLLILTVDETAAFRAREQLDEDTNSLTTLVLPPEVPEKGLESQRLGGPRWQGFLSRGATHL
jgi:hypothetical protein